MMKKSAIFFSMLFCLLPMAAQELKIQIDEKGRVGYSDLQGNNVIKCKYDAALPFENGFAQVGKGNRYGFINTEGKEVLPLKYEEIESWNGDIYKVKSGKNYGLVKRDGTILLPVFYTHISSLNCYGKAWVSVGGKATTINNKLCMQGCKKGVVNQEGKLLIEAKYMGLYEFSDKVVLYSTPYGEGYLLEHTNNPLADTLKTDCKYMGYSKNFYSTQQAGVLDENGQVLMKNGLYTWIAKPASDMVRYYQIKGKKVTCGYHNLNTGKGFSVNVINSKLADVKYWTHGDFTGSIAPVNSMNGWRFINKDGAEVKSGFNKIKHGLVSGLWAGYTATDCQFFDEEGNIKFADAGLTDVNFPVDKEDANLISVKKGNLWGVIDCAGNDVIAPQYDLLTAPKYGWMGAMKDGKWGYIRSDGTPVVECHYNNVLLIEKPEPQNIWVQKADNLWYNYNCQSNTVSEQGYKNVTNFVDGLAWVRPEGFSVPENNLTRAMVDMESLMAEKIDSAKSNVKNAATRKNLFVGSSTTTGNTSKTPATKKVLFSDQVNNFGIIISADNQVMFNAPLAINLYPEAAKIINSYYKRPLKQGETNKVALYLTRDKRSYRLAEVLGEENWDF